MVTVGGNYLKNENSAKYSIRHPKKRNSHTKNHTRTEKNTGPD
jgi:hypothetical protein